MWPSSAFPRGDSFVMRFFRELPRTVVTILYDSSSPSSSKYTVTVLFIPTSSSAESVEMIFAVFIMRSR